MSDAVRFIMTQEGHSIWNYIDDFLCVSLPSKIHTTFSRLQELLGELGLSVSAKKLVPPSTRVTCLGIQVDTVNLSISIPTEKLQVIKDMCKNWAQKTFCSKRELQSLLGSLLYVAKCVKYARYFLNRMLTLLRENIQERQICITDEFKSDRNWFNNFLSIYNVYHSSTMLLPNLYILMPVPQVWGLFSMAKCMPCPSPTVGRMLI